MSKKAKRILGIILAILFAVGFLVGLTALVSIKAGLSLAILIVFAGVVATAILFWIIQLIFWLID